MDDQIEALLPTDEWLRTQAVINPHVIRIAIRTILKEAIAKEREQWEREAVVS